MRRIFLFFFFVSVFGVHGADLVSGGRAQASILLPETAGAVERYAAEELIRYVRCITGAEIPVNAQLPLRIRFLSMKSSGGKNPLPAECGSLENDGFVIAVQNGFVDIISRKRRGFLYGVYFLLKGTIGQETASWACIVAAAPVALAGFFSYHGMTLERFALAFLKSQVFYAAPRVFRAENIYRRAMNGKGGHDDA